MMSRRVLLSWSSGKDSAWALHVLRQQPQVELVGLLTTFNEAADRVAMHAVRRALVESQALAAELPLLAIALDATFQLLSARGSRSVAARDFYQGYLSTDIAPDELLVEVVFHLPPPGAGWCFTEIARRHGDFAIVAVAVLVDLARDRSVNFARVALGGVGPAPLRVAVVEEILLGGQAGAEVYRRAGAAAAEAVEPPTDIHASSGYRRQITGVLVRRALATAEGRVKGQA